MYQEVRRLTRNGKKLGIKNMTINNKKGELKTELSEVKETFQEYIEDLYNKDGKPVIEDFGLEEENTVESDQMGPDIMKEKIYEAIKSMKNGKAAGIDDISAEFLKMLEGETLKRLFELCMEVYNTSIWPEDFTKSVVIPFP